MMNWEQLLSLKRQGDKGKRLRVEQDDTRLGFEVDYDRSFSSAFSLQDKHKLFHYPKQILCIRLTQFEIRCWAFFGSFGWKIIEKTLFKRRTAIMNDFGAIVAAASLHILNPPFGHSGEKAIEYFSIETDKI
jgi:dGTPase